MLPSPSIQSANGIIGVLSLEVVGAQNLPTQPKYIRHSRLLNPFVVISFARSTFRTRMLRATTDPVWRQQLSIPVRENERHFYVMFSVYDYDRLGYNQCVAGTNLKIEGLLAPCDDLEEAEEDDEKLALKLTSKVEGKAGGHLFIKASFKPIGALKRAFWTALARQYSTDETLSEYGLSGLLECVEADIEGIVWDQLLSDEKDISSVVEIIMQSNVTCSLESCPMCRLAIPEDTDPIEHLAICFSKKESRIESIVMGGFITEEFASRKWFSRVLTWMGFGGYRIGRNSANILVQDRRTGRIVEERIPTFIRLGLRWMYQNVVNRQAADWYMLRGLFATLTHRQGARFDDPSSVHHIPAFIRYHQLDMSEVLLPLEQFATFNEFFYRQLKPGARNLASPDDPNVIVSPADSRLHCFPTVSSATELWIKGANFTVSSLLRSNEWGKHFEDGSVAICRLAPQDYHRFHSPVDGVITEIVSVPGAYMTVNPMAVRQNLDVFTENARVVLMIDSLAHGMVAMVAVGAMMVGSVVLTVGEGAKVGRMDEVGYFAFGGSTVILLFEKGRVSFDADLVENSRQPMETLVRVGERVGISCQN